MTEYEAIAQHAMRVCKRAALQELSDRFIYDLQDYARRGEAHATDVSAYRHHKIMLALTLMLAGVRR